MLAWFRLAEVAFSARVAQLDRASVSEAEGYGFNSRRAHHFFWREGVFQWPGHKNIGLGNFIRMKYALR